MAFIIGLLTVVLVLDCLLLILLVLVQLPKKEAGAGLAFGAGATDALFGAGSGNMLTKITKYAATAFFLLAVVLSVMQSQYHRRNASRFERDLDKPGKTEVAPGTVVPSRPATTPAAPATNPGFLNIPADSSNAPAKPSNPTATPEAAK